MNTEILFAFIGATAALAIAPGPDNIYVLVQSVSNGKAAAMSTVFGLISGCIIHTSLLAFGVSALLSASSTLFFGIKLLGAIYMLFLAYRVYKSPSDIGFDTGNVPKKQLSALFVKGFFMNVLNPKVTLFFLAFFPGFLFSDTIDTVVQFYVLGGVFMIVSFLIFSSIAMLASQITVFTTQHKSSGLIFKWLQIVVFVGIAIFILC